MPTRTDNPFDALAEEGAQRLLGIVDNMPEPMDPMGERKLTRAEQLENYHAMREDPMAWGAILQEHGLDATIQYAKTMMALEEAEHANAHTK